MIFSSSSSSMDVVCNIVVTIGVGRSEDRKRGYQLKTKTKIIAGTVGLLAVGVIASAQGGNGGNASSSSSTPPPTTEAPTTTLSPVAVWAASYGSSDFDPIQKDLQKAAADAGAASSSGDFTALGLDCAKLNSDVSHALGDPPIPSPTMESHWSVILSDLKAGSSDCVVAIQNNDNAVMNQATSEISSAVPEMSTLNSELTAVNSSIG